ncbi:transmembrane protein 69 [Rhinatrema bivittatum]|uniref:transmembrane protein 69 n=1 Tax=Rhinatrema bivittatum TaxID=194408 RepID=UPI0011264DF2|nr:transmembrane protein 69 [Rhinatrema bivittatum]XP_029473724.1 transmembrane protein 69 [Rhinatrema bivittatum]XP_029473725.1 transmembrane protein 69 [Rhinatrema bivittatum]
MFNFLRRRCLQTALQVTRLPAPILRPCRQGEAPVWAVSQHQGLHSSLPRLKKRKVSEEPQQRELDLLRYDLPALREAPRPALYLGFGGLLPLLSAPLLMAVTQVYYVDVAFAQVAYGASILSFWGGARWGFALPAGSPAPPDWLNLAHGTVPALLAWLALLCRDSLTEAALLVIMGWGIALHYDLALLPTYPSWFKALRAILTLVATFSLVATLVSANLYPAQSLVSAQKN